jgi:endonuclease III
VTRQERADFIRRRLAELYPDPPVPLDHSDAFTLLIAVLLSAQCTDVRVNLVTPELFELGRTPDKLAAAPFGLGPQKAKAIKVLSGMLMADHGGQVPQSLDELENLPGVGHKTAQVVMAQAFGIPSFPVDTHIHRLGQRWGLTSGQSVIQTERDLKRLFPEESWNRLHLQIIFYGREFCTARGCDGTGCEICRTCYPKRTKPVRSRKA